jgi:hypothetical protein
MDTIITCTKVKCKDYSTDCRTNCKVYDNPSNIHQQLGIKVCEKRRGK